MVIAITTDVKLPMAGFGLFTFFVDSHKMKILLKIHEPLNKEYFISAEEVRGYADLGRCSIEKIQSLQIRFQGNNSVQY